AAEAFGGRQPEAHAVGRIVALDAFRVAPLVPEVRLERSAAGQARIAVEEIDAGQRVVEVAGRVALGRDDADARLLEHAELRAHHRERIGADRAELVLADRQRAELPAADAA